MQPEVSGKETDTWTEASGYRDHCIHGGGDLAHVGQCTVQYSTVQHSTAAVCSQSVRGGASVNISAASPQLSSLYCNTVKQ